jgi:mannose-1-phosphate guanylyltransferase/mannose-6-phosphate isomerase
MKISPIILCGGLGKRLWPLSRKNQPKQFLKIFDRYSLFQKTFIRACSLNSKQIEIEEIIIIANINHKFLIKDQIAELRKNINFRIILETDSMNTAPSLTLSSIASHEKNPESILVVLPSDHYVRNEKVFKRSIYEAIKNTKKIS